MKPTDYGCDPADHGILAHDGATVHRLMLHIPSEEERPVLVDAAGVVFNPWELQLLRWPPDTEPALRRGGYLPGRPADLELWCNCAD